MSNNISVKTKMFALYRALKRDTTYVHIAGNKQPKSNIYLFIGRGDFFWVWQFECDKSDLFV